MRHAVRRIIPTLGGVLLIGWGVSALTRPAPSARGGFVGRLAPVDTSLADGWTRVAQLSGAALDGGRILALDARDDTVVLAHAHAVSILVGGRLAQRFGSDVVGAPEFIGRGAGIALTAHGIALLDPPQHRLDFWSPEGERRARLPLPIGSLGAQYGAVTPVAGDVLVSTFRHGETGGAWWVWRITPTRLDTLVARYAEGELGGAFRMPLVTPAGDGFVLLDALHGARWRLDANGARLDSTARAEHPRAVIPARSRKRVSEIAATMPDAMRRALAVGDYGPSARALGATADGRLLVLTADLEDSMHVEVLDAEARAKGRLWRAPETAQLFLVRGAVYRVREAAESFVIDRLALRPHAP